MNKKFKIAFSLASIALLTGCNLEANPDSTAIMTAVNYEGDQRIVYSLDDDYSTPKIHDEHVIEGKPDRGGQKLAKGDYKPVWKALQNRLHINLLEHQAAANSGDKKSVAYFRDNWMTKTYADISMGTVYDINNYSVAGNRETILDLKPYLDETKFKTVKDPKTGEDIEIVDPDNKGPLPNIAKFFHDNPGVKMSVITAKHSRPEKGAIYYVPYFDGFNELEKGTIIRADYTKRLLDDDPDHAGYVFDKEGRDILKQSFFEPCNINTDGKTAPAYDVDVPNVDTEGKFLDDDNLTTTIHKNETKNIIVRQDELIKKKQASSYELAQQFKTYIGERYGAGSGTTYPFGDNISDLFLGWKACYDTDELVALMRLVKVSARTLFGKDKEMITMMPRACDNMRASDMYRWAGQTFGARGLESRNMYLYIKGEKDYGEEYGKYGAVHDARGSDEMVYVLNKLRSLYQEGLILQNFDDMTATGGPLGKFADDVLYSDGSDAYAGFMLYDYPKDLNDCNKYRTPEKKEDDPCVWRTPSYQIDKDGKAGYAYDLRAIVGSTVNWDTDGKDGPDGEYFPFTESWTSLKTSALCLNAKLASNDVKREATFKLIDYIYSPEGMILYNYGPWEDGYITERAGKNCLEDGGDNEFQKKYGNPVAGVDYIEYQGERFPCLDEKGKAYEQHQKISGLLRKYVGGTIPFGFKKLTVVPYQTMQEKTKHGVDVINKAVEAGSFRHVLIGAYTPEQEELYKNPFYQICPSAFFLTKGQSSAISSLLDKNTLGSMFTDSSTSNFNIWDALVMGKPTRLGVTIDNYKQKMEEWKIRTLETYYQDAFEIMSTPIKEGPTK